MFLDFYSRGLLSASPKMAVSCVYRVLLRLRCWSTSQYVMTWVAIVRAETAADAVDAVVLCGVLASVLWLAVATQRADALASSRLWVVFCLLGHDWSQHRGAAWLSESRPGSLRFSPPSLACSPQLSISLHTGSSWFSRCFPGLLVAGQCTVFSVLIKEVSFNFFLFFERNLFTVTYSGLLP